MEKTAKTYGFLISALITAFSFVVMTAIVMQLFSASKALTHSSENKTLAVNIAQTRLEEIQMEIQNQSYEEAQLLYAEPVLLHEEVTHSWKGAERKFEIAAKIEKEMQAKGMLIGIQLEIKGQKLNGEQEPLLSFDTALYKK